MGATPAPDTAAEPEGFRYDPIRSERRRSGVPAGAIAAGVAAIAVIGALGWYMNRSSDTGMAELTPGAPGAGPGVSEVAMAAPPANPLPMSAAGAPPGAPMGVTPQMAAISPPREAAPAAATRSPDRATRGSETAAPRNERPSRVRPAPANSAQEQGVDASATAPMIDLPAPQTGATGPTLNMPPEEIAPSLDPTPPSNSGSRAPSTRAPVAGDVNMP